MNRVMMAAIRGLEIGKSYRHFKVLKEISFEVDAGQCYVLFGSNGAGKTTLLKILATLLPLSSGRFEIMGHDGVRAREPVREVLLLLAHGSYLYNDLNAIENIRFAMALRGLSPTPHEIKTALDRVGIGAFTDFKIRHFSEGMKKRLAIAKAMLIRPRVLLMDEPYASLDKQGMAIMNQFIRESTRDGATVFMTSHNRVQSAEVADRAGILRRGSLHNVAVENLGSIDEIS